LFSDLKLLIMKNYYNFIPAALFFFCVSFISTNVVFAINGFKNSVEINEACEPLNLFEINNSIVLDDEVLIEKLKTALSSIYKENKLKFKDFTSQKSDNIITLNGTIEFYREEISVSTKFTSNGSLLSLSGILKPGEQLNNRKFKLLTKSSKGLAEWFPETLQKSIALDNISIAFDEASQKPTEIAIKISTINSWKILEDGMLSFNGITGELKTVNPTGSPNVTASLGGDFKIGPTSIKSTASVGNSKSTWAFGGELSDLSITEIIKSVYGSMSGIEMPEGVIDIGIAKSSFSVIPASKTFTLSGKGSISGTEVGELQLKIAPKDRNKLGFMVGISPASDFKMATIDPNLKMLDDLKITNFGMVLSSHTASKADLEVFKKLGGETKIGRGFNFIGAFDLTADGVNLDDLIGVKSVMIRAVVSNRLSDLLLEGTINTEIKFSEAVAFKKLIFRLKPSPSNFEVSMGGLLEVIIDKDTLEFEANMKIDIIDQAIIVNGLMNGTWNEPFQMKGLSIGNLGAEFGLSFRTTPFPLPQMGIKGELQIKQFKGDLFVYLNANNPTESAIDAGFNEVSLKAILEEFCDTQTINKIPNEIRNTVFNVNMKDVRITVAARPLTDVLGKDFEPGFRAKGIATIGDIAGANLDVQIGYDGIDASAGIQKISHLPFFELKGARGMEDPKLRIIAKASTKSKVEISGSATLLGLTTEAYMLLNDKGFDLEANGKIFDVFQAKLEVSGSRIKDGGSYRVAATMKQDFMTYVTKHASEEIDKATKKTQEDLSYAQNKISNEQKKLNALNKNIVDMRNTVKAERKRDLENIRNAKQAIVNEKRKHFNTIVSNINSINRKVKAAHDGIARKKKEIANASFPEDGYLAVKYTPYFTEQAAIIATQETAKVAQQGYKEVANAALIAAEESVGLVHTLGSKTPIDADPRIVALIGSKETANAAMEIGKGILEAAKQVGIGTLDAARWIVENGPTSVVNITYAHFEANLSAANNGSIKVHLKGTFAGNPLDEKFTINFNSPLESAKSFAESLL
jgi:hypothetical protein